MMRSGVYLMIAMMSVSAAAIPSGAVARLASAPREAGVVSCAQLVSEVMALEEALPILRGYNPNRKVTLRLVTAHAWYTPGRLMVPASIAAKLEAVGARNDDAIAITELKGRAEDLSQFLAVPATDLVLGVLDLKAPAPKRTYPSLSAVVDRFANESGPFEITSVAGSKQEILSLFRVDGFFGPRVAYLQTNGSQKLDFATVDSLRDALAKYRSGVLIARVGTEVIVIGPQDFIWRLRDIKGPQLKAAGLTNAARPQFP